MKTIQCKECGKVEDLRWIEERNASLTKHSMCYSCDFWRGFAETKSDPTHAVINGAHHVICKEEKGMPASDLGFGGQSFTIRFLDGREVSTRNLWFQGPIPDRWRDRIPDNAEFVKEATPAALSEIRNLLTP